MLPAALRGTRRTISRRLCFCRIATQMRVQQSNKTLPPNQVTFQPKQQQKIIPDGQFESNNYNINMVYPAVNVVKYGSQ
ncbi:hypothetical protein HBH98_207470 [Parastagonospora nodorum]|nr:hypothetical protein HBH51_129490 [Parastagonospora nodorum]KAH3997021.1 hypothetical protein HBI10_146060 [Parastagonospora nodorum]KAH4019886.1 hypothetical protein HBI13_119210 [Parastagonospora nodorum]KAH4197365.1 hypothetical protein HBH42_056170 [Parastagonospora nodorum]KAH4200791.1 hypothetical protein HBI95_167370 [Parastagonospora nodorum]